MYFSRIVACVLLMCVSLRVFAQEAVHKTAYEQNQKPEDVYVLVDQHLNVSVANAAEFSLLAAGAYVVAPFNARALSSVSGVWSSLRKWAVIAIGVMVAGKYVEKFLRDDVFFAGSFHSNASQNSSSKISGDIHLSYESPSGSPIPPLFPPPVVAAANSKDSDKRLERDAEALDAELKHVKHEAKMLKVIQDRRLELHAFRKGVEVSQLTEEEKREILMSGVDYLGELSDPTIEHLNAQFSRWYAEMQDLSKDSKYKKATRMDRLRKHFQWLASVCGTVMVCIGFL